MGNDIEDGVPPPPTTPPDTTLLDQRIKLALSYSGGGTGGGGADGSAARIAKLEADMSNLRDNVKDIKDALRAINKDISDILQRVTGSETEIRHLPGKGFIVIATVGALAFFGAVILFQHQIQQLLGLAPIGK